MPMFSLFLRDMFLDPGALPPGARGPRDFLALRDRVRRSASENLHSLFVLVCFVHDLVNRNR